MTTGPLGPTWAGSNETMSKTAREKKPKTSSPIQSPMENMFKSKSSKDALISALNIQWPVHKGTSALTNRCSVHPQDTTNVCQECQYNHSISYLSQPKL